MTQGRGWWRRSAVVLCVALIVGMMPITAGAVVPTTQTPLPHSEPKLGRAPATQTVSVTLPLAVDTAAVDAYLARVADPKSPDYHHYLTPAEYTARFVDRTARQDVVSFLSGQGLSVHDPGVGATIQAEAPASQIERAFSVQLDTYQATNGRTFVAADRTAALPANIAGRVKSVIGLDGSPPLAPHIVPAPTPTGGSVGTSAVSPRTPSGCGSAVTTANNHNAYTPNQFATAYNFDALYTAGYRGEGQTVALFELADFTDSNITTWKNCFGNSVPVTRVSVDGGTTDVTYQDEVELDIEIVLGLAPHLGQLLVYEAPNSNTSALDEYQRIANDKLATVVSTSWGLCEAQNSTTNGEYTVFQQMATEGMTVFAAAGDSGTNDCGSSTLSVDDPASQPYVSGVGGTHLTINSSTNAYASESVWNNSPSLAWAGGGGISSVWSQPSWQTGPNVGNAYSNGNRQVPDVAADADPYSGYVVFSQGTWAAFGGTSASAPLWAAGIALVNQRLAAGGGSRIGFGNPVWYTLLGQSSAPYHDVTVGNNCVLPSPCSPSTYPATAGYDQATGVGSPDFGAIAAALLPPAASLQSVTPNSGPLTGGTPVTITGANFRSGIVVRFGTQAATNVTVQNSGTLTAITPAQQIPGLVTVTVQNATDGTATGNISFAYVMPLHPNGSPVTGGSTPKAVAASGPHPNSTVVAIATPLPQPVRH